VAFLQHFPGLVESGQLLVAKSHIGLTFNTPLGAKRTN
jgi:hypothetical protein